MSAGFAGTLAMSVVMLLNDRFALIPQVDLIHDLSHLIYILTGVHMPFPLDFLIHLVLGRFLFGCVFAITFDYFRGSPAIRGILFGLALWLVMGLTVYPLLRQGFFGFGLGIGPTPAAAMLVLHVIYGFALGAAFGSMQVKPEMAGNAIPP